MTDHNEELLDALIAVVAPKGEPPLAAAEAMRIAAERWYTHVKMIRRNHPPKVVLDLINAVERERTGDGE